MKSTFNIKIPEYIRHGFDKYKYILLVCLVGLFLVLLPAGGETKAEVQAAGQSFPGASELAQSLEKALADIEGVGRVKVVLTLKSGLESVYAYDTQKDDGSLDENMVIISGGSAGQSPVVIKVNAPQYYGAVIICDGGDSGMVKLELTQAVSSLTGIKSDSITILKMKK